MIRFMFGVLQDVFVSALAVANDLTQAAPLNVQIAATF
jgi:hypothetical protein